MGGTILYPTDTIWGIGCDATNAAAVEKVYSIKGRDHSKSMLILCAGIEMVERYVAEVPPKVRLLLMANERPTTVIMPMSRNLLASNLAAADGTIGVRIPHMEFCQALLTAFGKPLVSTSANLSGHPSPACFGDIDKILLDCADFCVPKEYDTSRETSSSRIVKCLGDGSVTVIRE